MEPSIQTSTGLTPSATTLPWPCPAPDIGCTNKYSFGFGPGRNTVGGLYTTYDFMKSPDPKIIVAADAKKPTETVAARAFSLAESNFWLRNLKIRDYEALFARTIEDTNHPHLFNHDTPLGTAPKSRKRSITSQKATIWPFFAIFPSENTFYLVPRGCGSIKGVPWNHLTISKT